LINLLRANVGLLVWCIILSVTAVLVALIGYSMKARDLSTKPAWWFAGFIMMIGVPQIIGHAYNAFSNKRQDAPQDAPQRLSTDEIKSFLSRAPEGATVVDFQPQSTAGVLAQAEAGRFVTFPSNDTLIIARFASANEAAKNVQSYVQEAGLAGSSEPDGAGGFIARGNENRSLHIYPLGNHLVVQALRQDGSPAPTKSYSTSTKAIIGIALFVYVGIVALYFLKGLAWATRVDAKATAEFVPGPFLREQLLALNRLDIPFRIEAGERQDELVAIWRYADAKWIDLARAHGMRRLHRIVLRFDESERKVRATDFQTAYDWSAGGSGASFEWRATTGVVLFQYEHERVFGVQLGSGGSAPRAITYSYTFDLQEMKSPLIEAVTQSGWRWQPVAWQAPSWLRWATE
jgi:hypothetical protein